MRASQGTLEFRFERTIPARAPDLFDAWLNSSVAGNPWNAAESFLLDAKINGLFFWTLKGESHYGRFTEFDRPRRMRHTWVSPHTRGEESTVVVTFQQLGESSLMTLIHFDLPDHQIARAHEKGWDYFLTIFADQFGDGTRREYHWEEAHAPSTDGNL